jgi:hypothetical protein
MAKLRLVMDTLAFTLLWKLASSGALGAVAAATTVNAVRRHRRYAPLRARARTRQFVSALLAAVGEHDLAAIIGSFMTRQSLQRSWGGFQQTYR